MRAFIVDDDKTVADVTTGLLKAGNIDSVIADFDGDIIAQVRAGQFDVVLMDIMMPNVDGLELCRQIKNDAAIEHINVVIVSGKAYDFDKRRAKKAGADGYITKPVNPESFAADIRAIVEASFSVTYWGVRGTLPVPGQHAIRYGGNTSCVTMAFPNDRTLVFDAGTGIKALSDSVMKNRGGKMSAHLFISHPHWDHINAFPFFAPFFVPGNKFEVIGAKHGDRTMEYLLSAQMDDVFFPILVTDMGASITFRNIGEETITIDDDIVVETMLLSHPGNCLGYRVKFGGKSICYVTDNELYTPESGFQNVSYETKLIEFVRDTDILITDTTYFDEDYPKRIHWGHSAVGRVVDIAATANVKSLHLFHHDPDQSDDDIDRKLGVA
ncbi:MAG: response regulator, partial [Alphaproteobacteria bacterium]|nr:response regulator [Alphaproteobacteria bacterium]